MTESFRDVPHFPLTIDLEIDRLLRPRREGQRRCWRARGSRSSVNDFVIKAAAIALQRVPEANASYTPDGIAMHHHADIADGGGDRRRTDHPDHPRRRDQGRWPRSPRETKDLAERARARKLKPEEFQGGTFSVSNLGMFGDQVLRLDHQRAAGRDPVGRRGREARRSSASGQLAIATVMTVTLTCDHRVVDGAIGARFLQAFKSLLEDPVTMLA